MHFVLLRPFFLFSCSPTVRGLTVISNGLHIIHTESYFQLDKISGRASEQTSRTSHLSKKNSFDDTYKWPGPL